MTIPLSTRFDILQRDAFTCRFCGRRAPETELEVDHVHPRSKGGSDDLTNLVTSCRDCNRGKRDRLVDLSTTSWGSLQGKFLHTLDGDGYVERQGLILGELGQDYYTVQWFSWFGGDPSGVSVVHIRDLWRGKWVLYASEKEWRDSYEYQVCVKRRPVGGFSDGPSFISAMEFGKS